MTIVRFLVKEEAGKAQVLPTVVLFWLHTNQKYETSKRHKNRGKSIHT